MRSLGWGNRRSWPGRCGGRSCREHLALIRCGRSRRMRSSQGRCGSTDAEHSYSGEHTEHRRTNPPPALRDNSVGFVLGCQLAFHHHWLDYGLSASTTTPGVIPANPGNLLQSPRTPSTCDNQLTLRHFPAKSQETATDSRAVLSRPAPPPDMTLRYGPGDDYIADLRLPPTPGASPAPLILFLHGGFWRAEYDRTHTGSLTSALAAAGYIVCTPEFRRTGQPGGGWPGTFDDVALAADILPALIVDTVQSDVGTMLLSGHSAGGHLALWTAARPRLPAASPWHMLDRHRPWRAVVALAPVSDLVACHTQWLDNGAADDLMGGGPDKCPDRYALADPASLMPLGTPVHFIHGSRDDRVPASMSRDYAARAAAAGDKVVLKELPGCGHFELIDPLSSAWPAVLAAFQAVAPVSGR